MFAIEDGEGVDGDTLTDTSSTMPASLATLLSKSPGSIQAEKAELQHWYARLFIRSFVVVVGLFFSSVRRRSILVFASRLVLAPPLRSCIHPSFHSSIHPPFLSSVSVMLPLFAVWYVRTVAPYVCVYVCVCVCH